MKSRSAFVLCPTEKKLRRGKEILLIVQKERNPLFDCDAH
jgi:hypothetical protein